MSRETVAALQNLTNKMLKASSLAPPAKLEMPAIKPEVSTPTASSKKALVPNVTTPAKMPAPAASPAAAASPTKAPAPATAQAASDMDIELVPPTGRPEGAEPAAKPGILDSARQSLSNIDMSKIMEYLPYLGGMGAGGLAGYALGNMFQDEDEDSTPWLSTLAGAGLGTVALPYLLSQLSGGGQAVANAPAADPAAAEVMARRDAGQPMT